MGDEQRAGGGDDMDSQLALLRRLVDKLPAMIAYWDVDQRCRFANRAYETWFGVSPEALLGKELKSLLGLLYLPNLPHINGALLAS